MAVPGEGGLPFWLAVDLVIAMPVSWLPLVADYARFARDPRTSAVATSTSYAIGNAWFYLLGALLVLAAGSGPDVLDIGTTVAAAAGGGAVLLALLVGESDQAMANIYSGALSVQNVLPRAAAAGGRRGVGAVGVGIAAVLQDDAVPTFEFFLFLIGSVFVPLVAIFAAHYLVRAAGPTGRPPCSGRLRASGGSRSCPGPSASSCSSGACRPARRGGPGSWSERSAAGHTCRSRCSTVAWGRACRDSWRPSSSPSRCCPATTGPLALAGSVDGLRRRGRDEQHDRRFARGVADREVGAGRHQDGLPLSHPAATPPDLGRDLAGQDQADGVGARIAHRPQPLALLQADQRLKSRSVSNRVSWRGPSSSKCTRSRTSRVSMAAQRSRAEVSSPVPVCRPWPVRPSRPCRP